MYDIIKADLKKVHQALYSSHVVYIASSSSEVVELGDEPTQLRRIADATKAFLHQLQEEKTMPQRHSSKQRRKPCRNVGLRSKRNMTFE
jgi:hypothetical protein